MGHQCTYYSTSGQGPQVKFSPRYDNYSRIQIATGGEAMSPVGSRSSDGSSGISFTLSNGSWNLVQAPTTPMSNTSRDDFELAGSWVMESSYGDLSPNQPYTTTIGQDDLKPTFKTLGWTSKEMFNLYKFIIPKGEDPYFELLPGLAVTHEFPAKVYLDQPAYPQKNAFPCCHPLGCPKKKDKDPFLRAADLERHYKNVHGDPDQKDFFFCDYGNGKCNRHNEPFTRKDHYRDHLKDYHKEDIGCAKRSKKMSEEQWVAEQRIWEHDRKIYARNWRCAGCLTNNIVAEVGWECPCCKKFCEPERQTAREKLPHKVSSKNFKYEAHEHQYEAPIPKRECNTCISTAYPGYIDNGAGSWVPCPGCMGSSSWPASTSTDHQYS